MSSFRVAGSDRKDACTSTQEGLRIIEQLQSFLVHQGEEIDALKQTIRALELERDALIGEGKLPYEMKWRNAATQTEASCKCYTAASQIDTPHPE